VTYTLEDKVAVVRIDDGKANALSQPMIEVRLAALARADPIRTDAARQPRAPRAKTNDTGFGKHLEPRRHVSLRDWLVAAREQIADLASRALAVDQVERLVGEHLVDGHFRCTGTSP